MASFILLGVLEWLRGWMFSFSRPQKSLLWIIPFYVYRNWVLSNKHIEYLNNEVHLPKTFHSFENAHESFDLLLAQKRRLMAKIFFPHQALGIYGI